MKKNMGQADKTIRLVAAAVLAVLLIAGVVKGMPRHRPGHPGRDLRHHDARRNLPGLCPLRHLDEREEAGGAGPATSDPSGDRGGSGGQP